MASKTPLPVLVLLCLLVAACSRRSSRPYPAVLRSVHALRDSLAQQQRSPQYGGRLGNARDGLYRSIVDSLIPCWYGTDWGFNGTTETPGEGRIACGYFVTTVLRDAGLPVERVKLAQCASSVLIRATCARRSIRYHRSLDALTESLRGLPAPSLLLLGLDTHVGFISHEADGDYFLHASYSGSGVARERLVNSTPVIKSRTLMTGDLLANDSLICCWLERRGR